MNFTFIFISAVGNTSKTGEFNFFFDPEAAHILLEKSLCPITIVTWETTLETNIKQKWRRNTLGKIRNPILELLNKAEEAIYPETQELWWPCDAFLAAAFLYPEDMIKKKSDYHATVELHGSKTRGQMVLDHLYKTNPNAIIVEEVNEEFFTDLLVKAVSVESYKVAS